MRGLSFQESLYRSRLSDEELGCMQIAVERFIGRPVERWCQSTLPEDKKGVDYWGISDGYPIIGVDAKKRLIANNGFNVSKLWTRNRKTPIAPKGEELTLELQSEWINGRREVGWTLDPAKLSEYIFMMFDEKISKETYVFRTDCLLMATLASLPKWSKNSTIKWSSSDTGRTQCIFPTADQVCYAHDYQLEKKFTAPDLFASELKNINRSVAWGRLKMSLGDKAEIK